MVGQSGTGTPGWPTPGRARYSLIILLIAYTLSFADRMVLNLLIEPIKHSLKISDTQVSLLIGFAFATFYVVLGIPAGFIADKVNRKKLIATGLLGWSMMTGVCGMALSFGAMFVGRMGVGVGEATLSPSAYSILSDSFPRDKIGRAASIYAIGVPLGTGAALMLGGLLISELTASPTVTLPLLGVIESWRSVLLILAAVGVPIALLVLTMREPVRRDFRADLPTPTIRDSLRFVASRRSVLFLYLPATAVLSCTSNGLMTWIPSFLVRTYGVSTGDAGLYFGMIFAICGLGGLMLGGFVSDSLAKRGRTDAHLRGTMYAALLGIPFMILFPLAPSFPLALLALAPAVVAMAMPMGIALVVMQLMTPGAFRGQMTALYLIFSSLIGYGLGPIIIALLTDRVFQDPLMLRYSMTIASLVEMPVAAALYALSLKPYRACLVDHANEELAKAAQ